MFLLALSLMYWQIGIKFPTETVKNYFLANYLEA